MWSFDLTGAGGGGGGGVLVVASLGVLTIGAFGRIDADGGDGGSGGGLSGMLAGGGGGGAGGMVVLASAQSIQIAAHGGTLTGGDCNFAVSALGGEGAGTIFGVPSRCVAAGPALDQEPRGGYGGMGVVEFVAPPGANQDGTNTVLDDNIVILVGGQPATGLLKQAYLGWRGFPNAQGVFVDDNGVPTNAVDGDIHPAPVLLPWF